MTVYLIWGLLLTLTNGISTIVSRARNTPSVWYHGSAAAANHCVWAITNFAFVGFAVDLGKLKDPHQLLPALAFYTFFSTAGSIIAHLLSMHVFENSSDRRVGGIK